MQEANNRVEDVAALKEPTEDLRVIAVQELSAELDGVIAGDDREIVANLSALKHFIDVGTEKEGIPEAESRDKAHRSIRRYV